MTAVECAGKRGPFYSQSIPPPSLVAQRKSGSRRATSESNNPPIPAEHYHSHENESLRLVNRNPTQLVSGDRHYVNVCPNPLHPYHNQSQLRENSVSDSEISTSSVSALSESSEIRALFPSLYESRHEQPAPTRTGTQQPTADWHYNQLKVRPGSKASEKSRQILYRPHHFESDSSSSLAESCDSLNTQDNKHREIEHYNKLKLNLDNISGNKRAIFGAF